MRSGRVLRPVDFCEGQAMPISINGSSVGRVGKWLKRDGFAIVLFALTAIAMTFPLILHLNRLLIGDTTDVFPELWTTWWQHKAISEGLPLRYSNYLFYPGGFDATFSLDRWPELLMSWPLSSVIPITSTYNLIGLASLVFVRPVSSASIRFRNVASNAAPCARRAACQPVRR